MSLTTTGIIGIIVLVLLLYSKMPVGFAMGFLGLMGFSYVVNFEAGFNLSLQKRLLHCHQSAGKAHRHFGIQKDYQYNNTYDSCICETHLPNIFKRLLNRFDSNIRQTTAAEKLIPYTNG